MLVSAAPGILQIHVFSLYYVGQRGARDPSDSCVFIVFCYKPSTCVLQLAESGGSAGQGGLADLAGGHFLYYKPSTCVLQLAESGGSAVQCGLADLVGGHFPATWINAFRFAADAALERIRHRRATSVTMSLTLSLIHI